MAFAVRTQGRNILILEDKAGKSTADGNEKYGVGSPGANGFYPLGEFAGGSAVIELIETAGYAGTCRMYGSLDQSVAKRIQIGADQSYGASTSYTFQISKLGEYLGITFQRSTSNTTVVWKITITKACGTM